MKDFNEKKINLINQMTIKLPITGDEAKEIINYINRGGMENLIEYLRENKIRKEGIMRWYKKEIKVNMIIFCGLCYTIFVLFLLLVLKCEGLL